MGTRSTTRIYEVNGPATSKAISKLKPLLTIYRQMDGYPSGMGADLAYFVKNMTVVNGFGMGDKAGTHANGAGCFAAQLVKYLKDGIGGIYIVPTDSPNEEYNYDIYVRAQEGYGDKALPSLILVMVEDCNGTRIFKGDAKEFAAWVENQK